MTRDHLRRWLHAATRKSVAPGHVRFGDMRRTTPLSREFGFDRGTPIDRRYIERFIEEHGVRGDVLEVGEPLYATMFGGDAVGRVDILDVDETNPDATVVADVGVPDSLPADHFDCILCTQTLHLVFDLRAAVGNLHQALRPGGTALVTLPGISQVCRSPTGGWEDMWRVTPASAERLFAERFGAANVRVASYGNVFSALSFLQGVSAEELRQRDIDAFDPDYPVIVGVAATKAR
jgi:SAM-dependent methyltransferase